MEDSLPWLRLEAGYYADFAYAAQVVGKSPDTLHRWRCQQKLLGAYSVGTGKGLYIIRCPPILLDRGRSKATLWVGEPQDADMYSVNVPSDMAPNHARVSNLLDGVLDYHRVVQRLWSRNQSSLSQSVYLPAGTYVDSASATRLMRLTHVQEWHRRRARGEILGTYRLGQGQGFYIVRCLPLIAWSRKRHRATLWPGTSSDCATRIIAIPANMEPDYDAVLHIDASLRAFQDLAQSHQATVSDFDPRE